MIEDQGRTLHLPEPQVSPGDVFFARGEWWEVEQVQAPMVVAHPIGRAAEYCYSVAFVEKRMAEVKIARA